MLSPNVRYPATGAFRRQIPLFASLVALPLLHLATSLATPAGRPRPVTVIVKRVSDGDTITALTSERTKLRIRFLGIDAPEVPHGITPGQPYGEEARDYLNHLIGGKTVRVDAYGPDE